MKAKKLLKVLDIGKRRPYFDNDAIKVDKIKEICEWRMTRLSKVTGEEEFGDQTDKLIDIVIYNQTIGTKVRNILEMMTINPGHTKKELRAILENK
jgi:hypothetical protein